MAVLNKIYANVTKPHKRTKEATRAKKRKEKNQGGS
jgi:hypothetical protein